MDRFEKEFKTLGYSCIIGVDEVGRGCLAGPVCAAAVCLPNDFPCKNEIIDSKKLTPQSREKLSNIIRKYALSFAIALSTHQEIDELNILQATKKAMVLACKKLCEKGLKPDLILIDGNFKIDISLEQKSIVKGDSKVVSIAAASIIAKVYRDTLMNDYHNKYPEYKFNENKGYGTSFHCNAIKNHGICEIHRRTFAKVKEYV